MTEFLTTRELAAMLRVKERKIYEMASDGTLPVRRVTGKLLFPRDEIEAWIVSNGAEAKPARSERPASAAAPAIIVGGHDPLLEWALRESRSGIAALLDGALDALQRGPGEDYVAAGLHIPERENDGWNVAAVSEAFADQPIVLIEWAKRTRGLIFRTDLGRSIGSLRAARGLRFQSRQKQSGSEMVLAQLLERDGLRIEDLHCVETVERTEADLAMAIADGKADVGLGIEAMARQCRQGFTPLIVERFDLLIWRKAYFDPPMQKLLRFCASEAFVRRASELGGYDVTDFGAVHFNGP
ncbi:helix-turn-helix transcriptional regulator [Methylocapsa polymorpha]|uniref:Helix-turn-helix transcriptional regulator n=1 Tax=Methylocapsa polymorpha TaxID=3080828 RepID=A0ABZ0HU89_9HYPH|nr:helix-turn-helix transcriptional regulator [Methylocapsa sp. RX1]